MGRSPCCSKEGLNRGAWTAHEDKILTEYIRIHGEGRWRNLPKRAGLKRCGKSCRLRWLNYLRPDIKRGNISSDEEELIIRLHKLLGNKWSLIAGRLPGRTDNEIKNYWNTSLGKRVKDKHSPHLPNGTKTTQNPNSQTPTTSTPAPSLPPKLDSLVVRTKATKCSKVLLLNSLPNNSPMQIQNKSKTEEEVEAGHAVANIDSPRSNNQMEPGLNDNEFMSFLGEEKEELSTTDLLIDFDVEGISFSDFLNSDFTNMCNFDVDNNNAEQLSPCSDQTPMFSDEVFKDWTQSSFGEETNVSNKIH